MESTPFLFYAVSFVGIILGSGIICVTICGSLAVPGSFADRDHLRACRTEQTEYINIGKHFIYSLTVCLVCTDWYHKFEFPIG